MSLSFKGLKALIGDHLQADTTNGDWYLFFNKKRNYLKALWYDGTGFNIHSKLLDESTFPELRSRVISKTEFSKILSGAQVENVSAKSGICSPKKSRIRKSRSVAKTKSKR